MMPLSHGINNLQRLLEGDNLKKDDKKINDFIIELDCKQNQSILDLAKVYECDGRNIIFAVFILLLNRFTQQESINISIRNSIVKFEITANNFFCDIVRNIYKGKLELETDREVKRYSENCFIQMDSQCFFIYNFYVNVLIINDRYQLKINYNSALFDEQFIFQLVKSFKVLLNNVLENPKQKIFEFQIVTEEERLQEFIEWNNTYSLEEYPTNHTVHKLFEKLVELQPDEQALFYQSPDETFPQRLTYKQLNQGANQLAHLIKDKFRQIKKEDIKPGTFIGVCVERSNNVVLAKLAILKAGGAYVALDPNYEQDKLEAILEVSSLQLVISQKKVNEKLKDLLQCGRTVICLDDENEVDLSSLPNENLASISGPRDLAYLMFTSGSTGKPKGVMVPHRGIPNMACAAAKILDVKKGDRTLEFASINFDAAAWEIWIPLLNGASLYVLPDMARKDPEQLWEYLFKNKITKIQFMPPTMLAMLPRKRLPCLDVMVIAGEKCGQEHIEWWRKNLRKFVNAYGPAETTVCSACHVYEENDEATIIGMSLANMKNYVLDPKTLTPVPVGMVGELFIGGIGVTDGYLKNHMLTEEKFILIKSGNCVEERVYRTGDMVKRRPDGRLIYMGREDRQVKIHGIRTELEGIEKAIEKLTIVKQCAVKHYNLNSEQMLVAYIVPNSDRSEQNEENFRERLRSELGSVLSANEIPRNFVFLPELPVTQNGKIDYRRLLEPEWSHAEVNVMQGKLTKIQDTIINYCRGLLNIKVNCIDQNLFDLGLNSVSVASLRGMINQTFNIKINATQIYNAKTVRNVEALIQGVVLEEQIDFKKEALLPQELGIDGNILHKRSNSNIVFLTGATGFVGAHLLAELLQADFVKEKIYCLIRGQDIDLARARLVGVLKKYELWDDSFESRIIPVLGDLGKPYFGNEPYFYELAKKIGKIYHCAADVNFQKPYSALYQVNVRGTDEILRLAITEKHKELHYVSSVGVFGCCARKEGIACLEEIADTRWVIPTLNKNIGYDQSKWVAEQHVLQATEKGLHTTIHRLGFVFCSSKGYANGDDFWMRMIRGCLQMGCYPKIPNCRFYLVTVDYVVKALVAISQKENSLGKIFHLLPPTEKDDLTFEELFNMVSRFNNRVLTGLPYKEWLEKVQKFCNTSQIDNPLQPLLPFLTTEVYEKETTIELYANYPPAKTGNTQESLLGSDISHRRISEDNMRNYFKCNIASQIPEKGLAKHTFFAKPPPKRYKPKRPKRPNRPNESIRNFNPV